MGQAVVGVIAARRLAGFAASRAARGYVGGADLGEALATCARLADRGAAAFTLGFWNAAGEDPSAIASRYVETARLVRAAGSGVRIAIKAPALAFRRDLVAEVRANAPAGTVHLDAHGIEAQDATLALARESDGITLPGRWMRSAADALTTAARGLFARVVKGQFPATTGETDPARGFLAVIDALAGRAPHVFVATHDPALARASLTRLLAAGTPCELELLYGLPPGPALAIARELQVPVRAYVPWGTAYLPYALGAAKKNPRILAWLARDLVLRRREWPRAAAS